MAGGVDVGMDEKDLKAALLVIKNQGEPRPCAVAAQEGNTKFAFIMIEKNPNANALTLQTKLKANKKAKDVRFGTASVDKDDATTVRFTLNRDAAGLELRLKNTLTEVTNYKKAIIVIDAKLDVAEGQTGQGTAPVSDADGQTTAPPVPPQQDATTTGNDADIPPPPPPPPPGVQAPEVVAPEIVAARQKSRDIWINTRLRVHTQIDKLRGAIVDTYKDTPVGGEVEKAFDTKVKTVIDAFDTALNTKIDEMNAAPDQATQAKLLVEAKGIMARYATFAGSDPLVKDLDSNPFMPVGIQATVLTTVKALSTALK